MAAGSAEGLAGAMGAAGSELVGSAGMEREEGKAAVGWEAGVMGEAEMVAVGKWAVDWVVVTEAGEMVAAMEAAQTTRGGTSPLEPW